MKKVLVTGVSRGIGRAIAECFLNNGYELYGTFCSSKENAYELTEMYGSDRVKLFGPYDFRNLQQVEDMIFELKKNKYDAVISNAGMFSENNDFECFDIDVFSETMNCNFYTPLMLGTMLKDSINDGGSIVIVSSNDAYSGAFSSMSYSISKAALISLMKCLSVNYGKKNIRVNSVAPGAINTDMNTPEQMNIAPYFTPLSRAGEPIDVAKVVYFLSTDEAGFISGENITIDGGFSVMSILLKSEADGELSENLQQFIENKQKKE